MGRHERWDAVLEMLAGDGRLEVTETARRLQVSTATVRRDFDELAQQRLLTRTRGGARANAVPYDLPLRYKTARHAAEKERIAAAAADLILPGQIVGINGGTTTTEAARALGARPDTNDRTGNFGVTVVTNAINIANELTIRPHVKIVLTGGVVRSQSYELIGPLTQGVLDGIMLDIMLLGVDALSVSAGATAHNEDEASVNWLLASRAQRVVVIADSSKLGGHAFAKICAVDRVDELITDSGAHPDEIDALRDGGVQVTTV